MARKKTKKVRQSRLPRERQPEQKPAMEPVRRRAIPLGEYPPIVASMMKIGYTLLGRNKAGEIFMEKSVPEGKGLEREVYRVTRDASDLEFVGSGVVDELVK